MKRNRNVSVRAERLVQALRTLYPRIHTALAYHDAWQLLVATMLSAQTLDKNVNRITPELFLAYPNARAFARATPAKIAPLIRSINYYKTKAAHIVAAARFIETAHRGVVPRDMASLVALPGVVRKTANVVRNELGAVPEGIAVDTHVARLSRLFGLTEQRDPARIEQDLMRVIPRRQWCSFSLRLIQYGRDFCPARPHDHGACPLGRFIVR